MSGREEILGLGELPARCAEVAAPMSLQSVLL